MIKRILVPAATLGAIAAIAVVGASPSFRAVGQRVQRQVQCCQVGRHVERHDLE